ncbi:MAG: ATP-dependent helicase, partial [Lachnospiraceae bacterium]|nr:ATP-dependent helicase [Lachnospiraceae bacterium]
AADAVVFSTFHAAKGLEYEAVFIPDLNEDIVPHHKARGETDLEEERRLLYVGMTRAKKYLYLSFLTARYGRSQHPSRFLRVLLEK